MLALFTQLMRRWLCCFELLLLDERFDQAPACSIHAGKQGERCARAPQVSCL
jgi:hypothetical protein